MDPKRPALPRQSRIWTPRTFLLTTAIVGAVLAIGCLPLENLPAFTWSDFFPFNWHLLLPWLLVLSVMSSFTWAILAAAGMED